ncbi:hypothetical protein K438DRAFT_1765518 [Mycena galopus ATCC 62051]|nr:hypothetical protein K438DRAFT_1765518 [Mycena galopus ATCC 62051]
MASGSFPAIYKMLTILESQDEMVGRDVSPAYRCQFEEEYNIKIAPESRREAGKFASPTAEELQEEEEFLRRRYATIANFEHLAHYPLILPHRVAWILHPMLVFKHVALIAIGSKKLENGVIFALEDQNTVSLLATAMPQTCGSTMLAGFGSGNRRTLNVNRRSNVFELESDFPRFVIDSLTSGSCGEEFQTRENLLCDSLTSGSCGEEFQTREHLLCACHQYEDQQTMS